MKFYRLNDPAIARRSKLTRRLAACLAVAILISPGALWATSQDSLNSAREVVVDVEVEKPHVLVAERIEMKIEATAPQGVVVKFPELDQQLGDFEVMSVQDRLDIPDGSNRKWVRLIGLESLTTGELEIPAMELSYVDRRGSVPQTGFQKTPPQSITVRSTLEGSEDPTRFREIKSVVFAPQPQRQNSDWLLWTAGLAGLVVVAGIAIAFVGRRRALSPKQQAIKSLQELKNSRTFADKDVESIYIRLVSILRSFVQEQFAISAPRLTTNEFLQAMQRDQRLSDEFRAELTELLSFADMIKFAGLLPSNGGLGEVVDQAVRLVENAAEAQLDTQDEIPTAEDN